MLRVSLAFVTFLLVFPAAAAGAPYEHSSTIGVGAFAATAEKRYTVAAIEGEVIHVVLAWTDPDARLFVSAAVPGTSCSLTDPLCIAQSASGHELCSTISQGPGLYASPQVLTIVAPASGSYRVSVETFAVTERVAYTLSVAVGDGGAERVTGPQSFAPSAVVFAAPACAVLRS